VTDAEVPQKGWLHLDLQRTLGGVTRSYGWPIGALRGQIKLPGSALGGAQGWRATAPAAPASRGSLALQADNDATPEPASKTAARVPETLPGPAPEPQPRPPRRIPDADIIFVGRRPKAITGAQQGTVREPLPMAREQPLHRGQQAVDRAARAASRGQAERDLGSAPVPKIRTGVRSWLAVVSALAFAGLGFYWGTKWAPCHVIDMPAALKGKSAVV
jgi:hypothetical protein